jgi:hypothetical protein
LECDDTRLQEGIEENGPCIHCITAMRFRYRTVIEYYLGRHSLHARRRNDEGRETSPSHHTETEKAARARARSDKNGF